MRTDEHVEWLRSQLDAETDGPPFQGTYESLTVRVRGIGLQSGDFAELRAASENTARFLARTMNMPQRAMQGGRDIVVYCIARDRIHSTPLSASFAKHTEVGSCAWWSRRARAIILVMPMDVSNEVTLIHEMCHAILDPYPAELQMPYALFEGYAVMKENEWQLYKGLQPSMSIWQKWFNKALEYDCAFSVNSLCLLESRRVSSLHKWYQQLFQCQTGLLASFLVAEDSEQFLPDRFLDNEIKTGRDAAPEIASLLGMELAMLEDKYAKYARGVD